MHTIPQPARILLATVAAMALNRAAAQDPVEMEDPDLALLDDPASALRYSAAYVHRRYDKRHDALMNRNDYDSAQYDNWERGYIKGNANGIRLSVGKEKSGTLYGQYLADETQYEWRSPAGYHRVESDGDELQLGWRQVAETWEGGQWGWTAGFLAQKDVKWIETQEKSALQLGQGNVEWNLLQVGYFGEWTPLVEWLYFFGDVGGRFGEVEGNCRRGSDENWKDGRIGERYIYDSSIAYGAFASLGVGVEYQGFTVDVAYRRSWMYSFDATESGTVVFPDNDDALFIQNDGCFEFRAGYTATF